MQRLLYAAAVLVCACGGSPAPSSNLSGVWGGNALTNFGAQTYPFGEPLAMQVTVAGSTATVAGICPGGGSSVGPGTVDATLGTVGTGTYASWVGTLTCPPARVGVCDSMVFTYRSASVLAGTNTDFTVPGYPTDTNTVSFSGRGTSNGCGLVDTIVTSFIGVPTTAT
jgi:hypothetical protein